MGRRASSLRMGLLVLLAAVTWAGCHLTTPHDPRKFPDEVSVDVLQLRARYAVLDSGQAGLELKFSYTVRMHDSTAWGEGLNLYPLVLGAAGDTLFDGQEHPAAPALTAWTHTFADNWEDLNLVRFFVPASAMRKAPLPGEPLRYQITATDDSAVVVFPPFRTGELVLPAE